MEAIRRKEERKFFFRNPIDRFSSKRKRYTYAFARTVEVYRHPCTVTLKKRLRESGQFSTPIATFFSPDIPRYRSHNTGNSTTRLTSNRDRFFIPKIFQGKERFSRSQAWSHFSSFLIEISSMGRKVRWTIYSTRRDIESHVHGCSSLSYNGLGPRRAQRWML